MLANESVRYMTKMKICEGGLPATRTELVAFLDRLIMGQCGNFKVIICQGVKQIYTVNSIDEYRRRLQKNDVVNAYVDTLTALFFYTLNGHDKTLTLHYD